MGPSLKSDPGGNSFPPSVHFSLALGQWHEWFCHFAALGGAGLGVGGDQNKYMVTISELETMLALFHTSI